jgi:hypothetical protein
MNTKRFNKGDLITPQRGKGGFGEVFRFDSYDSTSSTDGWVINNKGVCVKCDCTGMDHCDPSGLAIVKTIFSVGDTIGVKPEYDKDGKHVNTRGMIRAIDATKYFVLWSSDPNGILVDYQHNEVDVMAYLIHKQDAPSSGGPHNCADHMEFCQGFRFDYRFCKVCGSKHNAA